MYETLTAALAHHAETSPDQLFLRVLEKGSQRCTRTYAEAWERAAAWAGLILDRGVRRGEAVVLALPNTADFADAYFGALLAGAVPAPVAPIRRATQDDPHLASVAERVRFLNAKALIVPDDQEAVGALSPFAYWKDCFVLTPARAEPLAGVRSPLGSEDDLALIQFTSGALGSSKAVQLTHRALLAQLDHLTQALALVDRERDWGLSWLPLYHDMGLIGFLLTPAVNGGTLILMPTEEFIFRPSAWLSAITEFRPTITGGPPSAYALCSKRVKNSDVTNYDLSSLRIALVGAEPISPAVLREFARKFGPAGFRAASFMPTYGLAENSLAVTMPPLDRGPKVDCVDARRLAEGRAVPRARSPQNPVGPERSLTSVGAAMPGTEIGVVDETGARLPERCVGEIVVRSPSVMQGYRGDVRATAGALHNGWLWTGDLGYLAEGELYVTGRKKEVIIVGGRNYYPDDVEAAVRTVPGVREGRVVAIGRDSPERGTETLVLLAETALVGPDERKALRLHLRQRLVQSDYPVGEVVLLKPKTILSTPSGKPRRMELKERYLSGELSPNGMEARGQAGGLSYDGVHSV